MGNTYLKKSRPPSCTPFRAQRTAYTAPKRALQSPISSSTNRTQHPNASTGQQTPISTHEQPSL